MTPLVVTRSVRQQLWNSYKPRKCWLDNITGYRRGLSTLKEIQSCSLDEFRKSAFAPESPAVLNNNNKLVQFPTACTKWFHQRPDRSPSLDMEFWEPYHDLIVPLELTRLSNNQDGKITFERISAPLGTLLAYINKASQLAQSPYSMYLAQHDLRDLPQSLQNDLPVPSLVTEVGKGDIYASSLWLGKAPTYTPLHCDPNPNLFLQLVGTKVVRLCSPDIGRALFDKVQGILGNKVGSRPSVRGEEMMDGQERLIMDSLIWPDTVQDDDPVLQHFQEATLHAGQSMFIPKGWWHSLKGVGDGITASANWWFR